MNMLPNMNLIADSLGWAVLHSIWQGALAAGIVYAVRTLTRERASEARYFTGIITLCALLCTFIGTFLYYYYTGAATISAGIGGAETITLALPSVAEAATTNPLLRLGDFTGLIGVFWAVCFTVLGMRYLSAFRLTHKLRKHGISDLSADWQARFRALVETSGVSPKVRAYFSEYVSSPITFGFLKPIVLVPTWFFTGMTPEQCEAVLLHELAHIRRHDYLTNILQIAIKTVFFYHPAVQFICKGLDTDREHACDDFAVMLTKNPEGLAMALGTIRLKAARDGGVFALSADGRNAPLMHRLKRLMGTNNSKTGGQSLQKGTSRGLAATAMIGTALALVMTLGATVSQAHPHKETKKENKIEIPDWDKLAGASPNSSQNTSNFNLTGKNSQGNSEFITVQGETYKSGVEGLSTHIDLNIDDDRNYYTINGKKYPSKYSYDLFSKDGKAYVVKQKNGKRYMEIGDNWFRVDGSMPTPPATPRTWSTTNSGFGNGDYMYGATKVDGKKYKTRTNLDTNTTYIKVDNKWLDIDETDLDVVLALNVVAPTPPTAPYIAYTYSYVKKDGETFKVKTKHKTGKSYIRVNNNWDPITVFTTNKDHGHDHIKINGKTYNLNTLATPPTPPTPSSTNYWVSDQVLAATEARAEAASERREAALERAEEARERKQEHAEQGREMAQELAELSREMKQDQAELMRDFAQDQAELQREIGNDSRELAQEMKELERELAHDQADLAKEFTQEQAELSREMANVMAETQANWGNSQYASTNYNPNNDGAQRARDIEQGIRDKQQKLRDKQQEARDKAQQKRNDRQEAHNQRARGNATRDEERRIRDYEREIAKMERKIAHKERDVAKDEASRARDIGRIERDIAKKQAEFERKAHNNPNLSQGELGRMQGEIGRMQGEIGRIQGANGQGQGDLGRLQGELGRMQGEIGRIQGEIGRKSAEVKQKKYYKMRDKLIPLLKADGFMKSARSKVTIKMTPTDIFINGKQLANAQESKYCDIVSKYISRKGDVKKIVIKPGYLHVSQKKDGHTNSFTHNEN